MKPPQFTLADFAAYLGGRAIPELSRVLEDPNSEASKFMAGLRSATASLKGEGSRPAADTLDRSDSIHGPSDTDHDPPQLA